LKHHIASGSECKVKTYAFADALKLYCREHHDTLLPQWQLRNQTKQLPFQKDDPIYGYSEILQWVGYEAREEDPDVWLRIVADQIKTDQPDIAVITDVRFPNEAAYIKENAGYLIEVRRINKDGSQYVDAGRDPNHPGETALDDFEGWDFVISCGDGDLKGLKSKSIGVYNIVTNHLQEPLPGPVLVDDNYFKKNFTDISDMPVDTWIDEWHNDPDGFYSEPPEPTVD
jgi:hypothetical protein